MTAGESCSRVRIQSKWTAVSSSPVRPGKTYPLSVLDHAMAKHTVHMVFYYRAGIDQDRLVEALADVLTHYPAVTGRMSRDEGGRFVVRCNDAGVRMHDAKVEVTLDDWFDSATAEEERGLAYWEPMAMGEDMDIWSPFYVQITEFVDSALAIGLSLPHMHADPTCASLLIKAWGDSYRRSYIVNPPFFHPPGLLPRPQPNLSTRTSHFLAEKSSSTSLSSPPAMLSATFRFSDESLKSLCPDKTTTTTPFDALSALFWLSVTKATPAKDIKRAALTLCVDFRKSMHAPLPHGFYGSALHFSKVEADLTSGWAHAAEVINRGVGTGVEYEEEYWSGVEWLDSSREPFQMYGPELTCVKMDHLLAYGAVFEGKPVHVACRLGGVEGEGVVIVMPSAEEGAARNVSVTLPAGVMEKVCRDEDILRHGPVLMFTE